MTGIFASVEVGHRALDYHLERHNILASNVANVETPGFRPRELVRDTPSTFQTVLALRTSDSAHLGAGAIDGHDRYRVAEERVVNPGNDENAVSLERELSKLGANDLRYETAARVVQMQLGQLRYAASDGAG